MKTIILSSIALMLSFFSVNAQAQTSTQKDHNYVVLTRKIPQLKPIILTAEALSEKDGDEYGDFQVVICGKTVTDLTDKGLMKPYLEQAEKA
ncbi:MAG: sulfur reduction protein DsrE, partial [Salegentibacter sp.]